MSWENGYNWIQLHLLIATLATKFSLFSVLVMCSSFHIEFNELYYNTELS